MTKMVLRTIYFQRWEKKNPLWASPCRIETSHPRSRISTRDEACEASLVLGWNSYPSGEISLSCMDTHGGLRYSRKEAPVVQCLTYLILIRGQTTEIKEAQQIHYENTPSLIYWKFHHQKLKVFGQNFYYFSYFCSKHRLWILVRTASPRRF